ncbi:hypothetical protein [Campylobacter hyointestinalis]|nr:hypothetical protein [Campylobacter hyointestinalis]
MAIKTTLAELMYRLRTMTYVLMTSTRKKKITVQETVTKTLSNLTSTFNSDAYGIPAGTPIQLNSYLLGSVLVSSRHIAPLVIDIYINDDGSINLKKNSTDMKGDNNGFSHIAPYSVSFPTTINKTVEIEE